MKCILEKLSILFFISFLFIAQVFAQTSESSLSFSYFPSDLSLNCSDEIPSVIDYPVVLLDTVDTGCNDILTLSFDDIVVDGDCPNSYIVERVWSAGICGDTISDVQSFSFIDTSPPTIISPIDGSHVCETDPMSFFPAAQDNCQLTVLLNFELDETLICEGITKWDYIITASDSCGNTTVETRSVYVHDIAPPTFLSVPTDQTLSCTESVNLESATYDCSIGMTYSEGGNVSFPNCSGTLVQTQTYSLTDMCGSTTNASRVITVVDSIPPILYVPEDIVVSCPEVPVLELATAFDECSNENLNVIEVVDTVISNCGLYTLIRTFSATDACGNTSTAVQTITVTDTISPVFSFTPSDLSFDCADVIPSDEELGMAVASDECSEVLITVSEVITSGVCPLTYIRERVFTAIDSCGNSVSATQTITVTDNTPPQIVVSSDTVYAECGDNLVNNLPDIIDDCSEFTVSTSVSYLPEGTCPGQAISTFTYTATDACGNVSSATKTVIITDNSPPIFSSIPPDTVLSCDSEIPSDLPTHFDECSSSTLIETQSVVLGDCLGERIVTRTFTITDLCGNSETAHQIVSFVDSTSPLLTIPADYTAECSDAHPMDEASATDNCGEVTIDVVETTTAGLCAGDYTITRTFTATDDCGNSSSATQTISLIDTTSPEFTFVPADYTAECSDAHPMDEASATDNCGEVTIDVIETTTAGLCAGDYTITREFTATDDCGNSSSATQTITIIDTTAPVFISVPADYNAECSDVHPMDDSSASDNCGEVTIEVVETTLPGDCAGDYTITRTFTATDDCGNATSATQTITIVDTTSPEFTFVPADYTAECSDVHPMDDASATDNCGEVSIDVVDTTTPGACAGDYIITRAFTATDDCGNATSATQTITITDTTPPFFTISPPTLIEVFWVEGDTISMPVAEIDDNCDPAPSLSVSESSTIDESPGSDLAQTITYVYLATDDCQNSTTYTSTLIYHPQIMGCIDTTACNYNPVANDDNGSCLYYDVFGICDGDNSLQAAIDATIAAFLEGGSNILSVPSGTYSPVSIPSSIELQAEAGVTIDASGLLIGISISGPSVTIDGLTIIGDGNTVAGIEIVSGADNAVIRNCDISGMALANPSNGSPLSYGILCYQNDVNISPVSGTLIEGNTIHNIAGAAISLSTNGAVGVQISQNTFSYISPVLFEGELISIGVQAALTSNLNVFDNSFDMIVGATSILLSTAVNIYDNSYSDVIALHVETTSDDAAFSSSSYWARAEVDIPGNTNVLRVYFANLDGDLSSPGAFTFANDGSEVVDSNGQTYAQDCNGVWDGPGIMTFCGCDIFDEDDDGVCPVDEVAGCTDSTACNFSPLATDEDGSCIEDPIGFDCDGNLVPNEFCGSGTVWNSITGTCEVIYLSAGCYFDTNLNGTVDSGDLLNLLSAYGLPCE